MTTSRFDLRRRVREDDDSGVRVVTELGDGETGTGGDAVGLMAR